MTTPRPSAAQLRCLAAIWRGVWPWRQQRPLIREATLLACEHHGWLVLVLDGWELTMDGVDELEAYGLLDFLGDGRAALAAAEAQP